MKLNKEKVNCENFEGSFSKFEKVVTSLKQGIFENLNVRKTGCARLSMEIKKFEYKTYILTD